MIGYAFCGSYCTLGESFKQFSLLCRAGYEIVPIMSENVYTRDTRFFAAAEFRDMVREAAGRDIVHTIEAAEPFGHTGRLESLIIAPCTGNTLAKIASGITDTAVTMAAKAHLRGDRPLLVALCSNDAVSQNLGSLSRLITRRSVYFVPMLQDDTVGKPYSLVAEISLIPEAYRRMLLGEQMRPIFLEKR